MWVQISTCWVFQSNWLTKNVLWRVMSQTQCDTNSFPDGSPVHFTHQVLHSTFESLFPPVNSMQKCREYYFCHFQDTLMGAIWITWGIDKVPSKNHMPCSNKVTEERLVSFTFLLLNSLLHIIIFLMPCYFKWNCFLNFILNLLNQKEEL